uniref:Secreted protein n=1 Tax=Panagrellus redivivus TaxID=6233 RepID=A0A7E4VXN5_PANRE
MVAMLQRCLGVVILAIIVDFVCSQSDNLTSTSTSEPSTTTSTTTTTTTTTIAPQPAPEAFRQYGYREHWPPPPAHLKQSRHCVQGDELNPMYDCHGAKFNRTMGFFQPCSRHAHCYNSREPSDWCLISNDFMWTNWGCHCDKKIGSCVIERYSRWDQQTQWAYCVPKNEFYCATRYYNVKATLHSHNKRQHN